MGLKVELLFVTPNAEEFIGKAAAICYDADTSDTGRNLKRAAHCVSNGHLSTLRFANAVFQVSGISRAAANQFVRSKHLEFLQESQRYVKVDVKRDYDYPPSVQTDVQKALFDSSIYTAGMDYERLLLEGVKKEDARMVLPLLTATMLNVTGNFQSWVDFINLRKGKEVQYEIRMVAHEIHRLLMEVAPNVFGKITL